MKLKVIFTILVLTITFILNVYASKVVHVPQGDPWANGFWQKKTIWKARWVKTWQERKVYIPLWKRVWGPVELNEWVPLPKPPPGWSKHH